MGIRDGTLGSGLRNRKLGGKEHRALRTQAGGERTISGMESLGREFGDRGEIYKVTPKLLDLSSGLGLNIWFGLEEQALLGFGVEIWCQGFGDKL